MYRNCNSKQKWHKKQNTRIYKRETYNWVMWQVELDEHSHLIKGLWFGSLKVVESSMAAPLHGSPLIFH